MQIQWQKGDQWFPGTGVERRRRWDYKGTRENWGAGDGYVHYLGCSNGFTGVHVCQHYQNLQFKYVQFIVFHFNKAA